jgi:hypothetical protein
MTARVPVLPPPPLRLSTTTGCPSVTDSLSATMRAMLSTPPPGGYGTTSVIGLVGYSSATTATQNRIVSNVPNHAGRHPIAAGRFALAS